jgi:hypothetical protein
MRLKGSRRQRLRRRHLYRTRNRCEDCGEQHEPGELHLHHRNGRADDDSDANLVVLCIACHRRTQ